MDITTDPFLPLNCVYHLLILLSSDWLKRSTFLVNTVQKSVTWVQLITTKISEVKTKTADGQLIYFEDCAKPSEDSRRTPEHLRGLPKTTQNLPKIAQTPLEDFRRSAEYFQRFPKMPEHFWKLVTISRDLRRSPDYFRSFSKFRKIEGNTFCIPQ